MHRKIKQKVSELIISNAHSSLLIREAKQRSDSPVFCFWLGKVS